MKIGQTAYIVGCCRHLPGDFHFYVEERWVISFDQDIAVVATGSNGYAGLPIHTMIRSAIFECPFEAANNVDRVMNDYDTQGVPKVKDEKAIASFLAKFQSDEATVVEKKK